MNRLFCFDNQDQIIVENTLYIITDAMLEGARAADNYHNSNDERAYCFNPYQYRTREYIEWSNGYDLQIKFFKGFFPQGGVIRNANDLRHYRPS